MFSIIPETCVPTSTVVVASIGSGGSYSFTDCAFFCFGGFNIYIFTITFLGLNMKNAVVSVTTTIAIIMIVLFFIIVFLIVSIIM